MARILVNEIKDTRKNYIINGNFDFWQRHTSHSPSAGGSFYTSDRWGSYQYAASVVQVNRVSSALTSATYALKMQRASGSTNTQPIQILQPIESIFCRNLRGKTVTLAFYAKAGSNYTGGALGVKIVTGTGTDESWTAAYTGEVAALDTTQSITTSTVKYVFTASINSNINEMYVRFFYLGVGTAGADDSVTIEKVMLVEGQYSDPEYPIRDYTEELALCQRYYEKSYDLNTPVGTATQQGCSVTRFRNTDTTFPNGSTIDNQFLKIEKRATPTISIYSYAGTLNRVSNGAGTDLAANSGIATSFNSSKLFRVTNGTGGSLVNQEFLYHWVANAEL